MPCIMVQPFRVMWPQLMKRVKRGGAGKANAAACFTGTVLGMDESPGDAFCPSGQDVNQQTCWSICPVRY